MKKKKYDLTSDLIDISEEKKTFQLEEKEKPSTILVTMSIEEELKAEFKSWCARHRYKMSEAFVKGFKLLKEKYGP